MTRAQVISRYKKQVGAVALQWLELYADMFPEDIEDGGMEIEDAVAGVTLAFCPDNTDKESLALLDAIFKRTLDKRMDQLVKEMKEGRRGY